MPITFLDDTPEEKTKSKITFIDEPSAFDRAIESPVGVGIRQGASDVANMPRALGQLGEIAQKWVAGKLGNPDFDPAKSAVSSTLFPLGNIGRMLPDKKWIDKALFGNYDGPAPPKDNSERYTRAAARGASGTLALGGFSAPALLGGTAASVASEGATQALPDSQWAPLVAGLLGGGLSAGTYNLLRPSNASVARGLLSGVDDQSISRGRALQQSAMDQGLGPLPPGQALNNRGILQVERLTEQSPQGGLMQQMYQQRGPMAFGAAKSSVGDISAMSPRQGFGAVQSGAQGAINNLRQTRDRIGSPLYKDSFESVRPIGIDPAPVFDTIRKIGDTNPAVRGTLDRLANTVMLDRGGNRITDLEQLQNGIKMSLDAEIGAATTSGQRTTARALGEAKDKLLQVLDGSSSQFKNARETWAKLSVPVTQAEEGLIGQILAKPDLKSAAKAFLNPSNETPQDIAEAGRAITAANADAVPAMVKQYLNAALQQSAKATRKDTSRVGAQFADEAFGPDLAGTDQLQNIKAAVQLLPDGDTRWLAFERMNDVFRAQGRRLQVGSPTDQNRVIREKLSDPEGLGAAAKTISGPGDKAWEWLQNARLTGNYARLSEIFSAPDSIDQLRALAREPDARRAESIVNNMLTVSRSRPTE